MRSLGALWLIVFIGLMGFGITVLPFPLVAEQFGASDFWKTFGGAGIFSLFQFLSTPLWGRCSDAWGRKRILALSMAGSVLAYLWLAYAGSLTSLIVARAFGGIMSGNIAAAFAYATDVTDVKNRARGLGIVTSAFGLGFAVGPLIGAYFGVTADGTPSLFWPGIISAVLSAIALLGTILFLPESLPVESRKPFRRAKVAAAGPKPNPFASPNLLWLLFAALCMTVAGACMQSVYPFWARDVFGYGVQQLGPQFFLLAILSATGQLGFVGPMVKRFGEKPTAMISLLGIGIGLLLLAAAQTPIALWGGIVIFGLSMGLVTPSLTSLISFEADPKNRGALMGYYQATGAAGRIVGPAIAGPLYFSLGHSAPYLLSAALVGMGALLLTRVSVAVRQRP